MLPPLLADVNVAVSVVQFLRDNGIDVSSLYERDLASLDDEEVLALGTREKRFVLTHDADFGRLAIASQVTIEGVLFVRPGDDPPSVVIERLRRLMLLNCDWSPPLLAVYQGDRLRFDVHEA